MIGLGGKYGYFKVHFDEFEYTGYTDDEGFHGRDADKIELIVEELPEPEIVPEPREIKVGSRVRDLSSHDGGTGIVTKVHEHFQVRFLQDLQH